MSQEGEKEKQKVDKEKERKMMWWKSSLSWRRFSTRTRLLPYTYSAVHTHRASEDISEVSGMASPLIFCEMKNEVPSYSCQLCIALLSTSMKICD